MSLSLFQASRLAIKTVGRRARGHRMRAFCELFQVHPGMTILDLGGRPEIWQSVPESLDITFLNLPGETGRDIKTHHRARFVEGDACDAREFTAQSFDLVFSNSVIEHVGPLHRQRAFAEEIRRIGRAYWVQTPSKWFPIEAHTGMPFWWFYPGPLRQAFLDQWVRRLPAWTHSMANTRVLSVRELLELFPGSTLWVERLVNIPKSYAVYSMGASIRPTSGSSERSNELR